MTENYHKDNKNNSVFQKLKSLQVSAGFFQRGIVFNKSKKVM